MNLFGRINREHWNELTGVLIVIFAIWLTLSLIGYGGEIGNKISSGLKIFLGYISFLLVLIIGYWGVSFFVGIKRGILSGVLGSISLLLSGLILFSVSTDKAQVLTGTVGKALSSLIRSWTGIPGLILAGIVSLMLGVTLLAELTFRHIFKTLINQLRYKKSEPIRKKKRTYVSRSVKPIQQEVDESTVVISEPIDSMEEELYLRNPATTGSYVLPKLSLLNKTVPEDEQLTRNILQETARVLERSFQDFNIDARVLRVKRGPAVTRYEIQPGPGVKVSKFVNLADDLALVLRATRVRVVAPVPGAGVVGIEVPNEKIIQVGLREVLESQAFRETKSKLALPLGKDISGTPVVADLASMPHLLIAGTTGSGKSVFINCVIASMLFRMTPEELRFLMIDPKKVELSLYDGIPHLLAPVVTDSMRAPAYLKWVLREIEKRYKKLADVGVRNIDGYNAYLQEHPEVVGKPISDEDIVHAFMPYILIIIDELADLMMVAGSEVETLITRLAQIARAAGVHMLVATQRPSVDVVTGLIKANLPCRLSFRLASKADSRTILDMNGAENLIGKGDMLFMDVNTAKPIRIQGCYISEAEIERLVNFIKQNSSVEPDHIADFYDVDTGDEEDSLYERAVKLVIEHQTASTSFLQRKLNISYEKALELLEDMETNGIVGPNLGKQSREVLVNKREKPV